MHLSELFNIYIAATKAAAPTGREWERWQFNEQNLVLNWHESLEVIAGAAPAIANLVWMLVRNLFVAIVGCVKLWQSEPQLVLGVLWAMLMMLSVIAACWAYVSYHWNFDNRGRIRSHTLFQFKLPILVARVMCWPASLFYYGWDVSKWLDVQFHE
jgi:hypothetical protein